MTRLPSRDDDLRAIRATYERYGQEGRGSLWDLTNSGYARLATERDATLVELIRASVAGIPSPRLLDVGCGTGSLGLLLGVVAQDIAMTGVDLLEDRVAIARERVPTASFRVGSADRLEDDDATYDVVSAITLFSSLPTPDLEAAVAAEMSRVLRPGGWVVWYDLRFGNPSNQAVHGLSTERLTALFPGWHAEIYPFSVAPPVARRLGALTPVLYPLLHAIRPIRSHLIGRVRKPMAPAPR